MGMTCRMTSWGMPVASVAWRWALRAYQCGEWESQVRLLDGLDSAVDLTRIAMWLWLALAVLALALSLGELCWRRPASRRRWLEALGVSFP